MEIGGFVCDELGTEEEAPMCTRPSRGSNDIFRSSSDDAMGLLVGEVTTAATDGDCESGRRPVIGVGVSGGSLMMSVTAADGAYEG